MIASTETESARSEAKFVQGLGLLDSTMIVAGSMIGSGIFIVSAEITRQVGSGGWLLAVWAVTGLLIEPIKLPVHLALSLSWQQLMAILLIVLLTFLNTQGLRLGKLIQNTFTSAKTLALIALILIGLFLGRNAAAIKTNFSNF